MSTSAESDLLRIATRGSRLALAQARLAVEALGSVDHDLVVVATTGDRDQRRPFEEIGPKGVFVREVEAAVLDGRADVAIHSLKDVPAGDRDGLSFAAFLPRADARDAVVGARLETLPPGSAVGTSSARRRCLLALEHPELNAVPLRGNVDTRLQKIADGQADAAILAMAGLARIGSSDAVVDLLDPRVWVPPPGQGAIVIQCRQGEDGTYARADDQPTRAAVSAERAFMSAVEGGCDLPLGAWARLEDGQLVLDAFLADGQRHLRDRASGDRPEAVGEQLAARMLSAWGAPLR